jgi:crotonobetainyl-CoA:carnitine CoA-transferase CaiB-like acyl-CoA transferase
MDGKMSAPRGPLAGMRVIELAHVMAGPVCGLMLADMGAEVIKVEKPEGDDTRRFLPPDIKGESAAYMMMNRNKRGIVLDLKQEAGREALLRLVDSADVLVENYRAGTLERLGLGYEVLRQRNPRLVYCSISGFGRSGPYAQRGGYDLIAQGMSGLMSITGEAPGRPPVKTGAPITDITAGILGALGCVAAYAHAQRTGEGQLVDTSLFEAGITQTYWQSAIAFATGLAPGPMGSAHPLNAPYQALPTSDGWITVGAANSRNWERLLEVLDLPALAEDARFVTNDARMANLAALEALLSERTKTRASADWLARMEAAGLPAGPVLDILQVHADPHAQARDMFPQAEHPVAGTVRTIGLPVKFSATPGAVDRPAPMLGQHGAEVMAELDYSEEEIAEMTRAGVLGRTG